MNSSPIKAEILLDSIGADGSAPRLTTWLLTFPRFILAEVNTHRMFSRNYPSSRAIPVLKRMGMVIHSPVMPIEWGLDKPGMQAGAKATGLRRWLAERTWRAASLAAVVAAFVLVKLGIHKQVANRILEPFVMVTGLVTATQDALENAFALRADDAADPHIQALFYQMLDLYNASTPQVLQRGEWHIPFGDRMPPEVLTWDQKIKVAVARAARLSFNQFDGSTDVAKDYALHDRLAEQGHWSSFEHIAQVPVPLPDFEALRKTLGGRKMTPKQVIIAESVDPSTLESLQALVDTAAVDPDDGVTEGYSTSWNEIDRDRRFMGGNLPGWIQLRKTYPNEFRKDSRVEKVTA